MTPRRAFARFALLCRCLARRSLGTNGRKIQSAKVANLVNVGVDIVAIAVARL
jgi:hypothetical protein